MISEVAVASGVVVVLLVLSAFFSGSETALTAASRARMHQLEKRGDRRARIVSALMESRDRTIISLLFSNNLVNILASAFATSVLIKIFGDAGVLYATSIMTILILIFAEVTPKVYAASHPDQVSLRIARIISPLVTLLSPVSSTIQASSRIFTRFFGIDPRSGERILSAHDELRGAINLHHLEGEMVKTARDMLEGILDLKELAVSDLMIHRTNMIALDADLPPEQVIPTILSSTHTRIPLWRNEPENIIGVLHAKDLARALTKTSGHMHSINLAAITTAPWFVLETTNSHDQLNAFLKRKSHFALVVDEYGGVKGLVTLEDILEVIVGEIIDEHDISAAGVRPQPDGTVIVDGSVPIRDLNRAMDWDLPDDEATTIAGFVIHEARRIPEQAQTFTFHGYRFHILRRRRNRIASLKISPLKDNTHGS